MFELDRGTEALERLGEEAQSLFNLRHRATTNRSTK